MTVNNPLTETERQEFGKQLLSQSVSEVPPNILLDMFCNIKLIEYLNYLESTGLYYKRNYLNGVLGFLMEEAETFRSLVQKPLTVGTLIFLAKLLYKTGTEPLSRSEQDEVNGIVVKLLLQPIAILTERTYHYTPF